LLLLFVRVVDQSKFLGVVVGGVVIKYHEARDIAKFRHRVINYFHLLPKRVNGVFGPHGEVTGICETTERHQNRYFSHKVLVQGWRQAT